MSMRVNMHEAKTNLSRLVAALEAGETDEIEIARAGRTVARLVRAAPISARRPGRLAGRIRMADDFDAPLPRDIAGSLEGRGTDS
jgi:antitoxin (DNA-binding transcriptional repressor) of toxin-antitoxin stability system